MRQWAKRGTRPRQPADQRYDNAYLFGAICPARGVGAALALPYADTDMMHLHLDKISRNVAEGAHAVLVLTEWDEFRKLDLKKLRRALAVPVMVDGRNLYRADEVHKAGLEYISMGRPGNDPVVRPISPARGVERRRMPAIAASS